MKARITEIKKLNPHCVSVTAIIDTPTKPWNPISEECELSHLTEEDIAEILAQPRGMMNATLHKILKEKELPPINLTGHDIERLEKEIQYYRDIRAWEAKMKEYDTLHLGAAELRQKVEE